MIYKIDIVHKLDTIIMSRSALLAPTVEMYPCLVHIFMRAGIFHLEKMPEMLARRPGPGRSSEPQLSEQQLIKQGSCVRNARNFREINLLLGSRASHALDVARSRLLSRGQSAEQLDFRAIQSSSSWETQ